MNTDQKFHINIEENLTIRQDLNKYLGVSFKKNVINSEGIASEIFKGRKIIGCLNSLWCNKNTSLERKR
jgi:hypothetical protein